RWTPSRSETSPSQYGRIVAIGTPVTLTRAKSVGARGSTARILNAPTWPWCWATSVATPSPPREWPMSPTRPASTAPTNRQQHDEREVPARGVRGGVDDAGQLDLPREVRDGQGRGAEVVRAGEDLVPAGLAEVGDVGRPRRGGRLAGLGRAAGLVGLGGSGE